MPSSIEWTEETWNPVRGCQIVSPGCANCYAMRQAARMMGKGGAYEGLVRIGKRGPTWTGDLRFVPDALTEPLRWRRPRRVFVNSMSDLFAFPFKEIAAVFGIMAATPQHTYQVLTKREAFMLGFFDWLDHMSLESSRRTVLQNAALYPGDVLSPRPHRLGRMLPSAPDAWPLPNVVLMVSAETQKYADLRVPALLKAPAAVRGVSYEPALGPVSFGDWLYTSPAYSSGMPAKLDWVIVGGESGPHARPFDIRWAESVVRECREAGVACFVKQLGAVAYDDAGAFAGGVLFDHRDRKGADMAEWPSALRVRQYPEVQHVID